MAPSTLLVGPAPWKKIQHHLLMLVSPHPSNSIPVVQPGEAHIGAQHHSPCFQTGTTWPALCRNAYHPLESTERSPCRALMGEESELLENVVPGLFLPSLGSHMSESPCM